MKLNRSWNHRTIERGLNNYDIPQLRGIIIDLLEENRVVNDKFDTIKRNLEDIIRRLR